MKTFCSESQGFFIVKTFKELLSGNSLFVAFQLLLSGSLCLPSADNCPDPGVIWFTQDRLASLCSLHSASISANRVRKRNKSTAEVSQLFPTINLHNDCRVLIFETTEHCNLNRSGFNRSFLRHRASKDGRNYFKFGLPQAENQKPTFLGFRYRKRTLPNPALAELRLTWNSRSWKNLSLSFRQSPWSKWVICKLVHLNHLGWVSYGAFSFP